MAAVTAMSTIAVAGTIVDRSRERRVTMDRWRSTSGSMSAAPACSPERSLSSIDIAAPLAQELCQPSPAAVQVHTSCRFATAEQLGDLGDGPILVVVEHDGCPLGSRQMA